MRAKASSLPASDVFEGRRLQSCLRIKRSSTAAALTRSEEQDNDKNTNKRMTAFLLPRLVDVQSEMNQLSELNRAARQI